MKGFLIFASVLLFARGVAALAQVRLDSMSIGFTVSPSMLEYANEVLRANDEAHLPIQWISLAPSIVNAKVSVGSPSLGEAMTWHDSIFAFVQVFGYDFEHWSFTPDSEQANPTISSMHAMDFAHSKCLEYTLGPDLRYATTVGPEMAVYADRFVIQGQRLQSNPGVLADTLRALTARIHNRNPNCRIWVQLGAQVQGQLRPVDEMIAAAASAAEFVDGFGIFYGSAVDTLKKFISWLRGVPTGIKKGSETVPSTIKLEQNYPNPFNPTTTIRFSLPQREFVTLKVFDVLGREVITLVDRELSAGEHSVIFDAENLTSGVYFYQIKTPAFSQTRKAMEMR